MKNTRQFSILLPTGMHSQIRDHLFRDPSKEYMGVILAGFSETGDHVRLLGRRYIPIPADHYEHQSGAAIRADREFSQQLMQICAAEGLSQIDVHSHPFGPSPDLWFSGTDDLHEREMAQYIYERLDNSLYASIVMNQGFSRARIWLPGPFGPQPQDIPEVTLVDFPYTTLDTSTSRPAGHTRQLKSNRSNGAITNEEAFSRQILAFGKEGQARMSQVTVTVVGAGGLGSILIEGLARLGFGSINIIDPDKAEHSNLNRVVGMSYADAVAGASKVAIACRQATLINPSLQIAVFEQSVFDRDLVDVLKTSNLVIAATDNHATRMYLQRIGAQYLVPVVSAGVNIEVDDDGTITDVSGECAIALPGPAGWCLSCGQVYDSSIAAWELSDQVEQKRWIHRGYVTGADVASPSVIHLNGVIANLALAEIHNLFAPYKKFDGYLCYNQLTSEIMRYTISRQEDCAFCGDEGLLGLGDIELIPDYQRMQKREVQLPQVPAVKATDESESNDDGDSEKEEPAESGPSADTLKADQQAADPAAADLRDPPDTSLAT